MVKWILFDQPVLSPLQLYFLCKECEVQLCERKDRSSCYSEEACGGCLMWAGARLPNAQQSVAQATTIRPCSCAIVRLYLYTIVCIACAIVRIPLHDCIHYKCNCVHSWTSFCAHTNAQCSLNTMPKIWAALNHSQSRLFCAHIA